MRFRLTIAVLLTALMCAASIATAEEDDRFAGTEDFFADTEAADKAEPQSADEVEKAGGDDRFDDFEEFYDFAKTYADDVVEILGDKVDELEKRVMDAVPEVKHIDVEPD